MSKLTDREVQIVQFMADGLDGPQIAKELGMSVSTIRVHLTNIRNKSGMDTSVAAVAWCLRNGVID